MKRVTLGRSGLTVSRICLGTMTWGSQTAPGDAMAQIDRALDAGLDFLDTAEMYPTNPVRPETVGRTEEIIGQWITRGGDRGRLTIATKVTGPGQAAVRQGQGYNASIIRSAVEGSLRRMRTEAIDLYQLHWPVRGSYHFRRNWAYDPSRQDREATIAHMTEVLGTIQALMDEGKIRAFGLSNETAWGTAQWLALAEAGAGPRVASVQNEYSLLCRLWDTDMAELSVNEDVTLLAFSPLGAGLLSGKYQGDQTPAGTRRANTPDLGGRISPRVFPAIEAYLGVAEHHGLDPVQMAVAWQFTRPFPVIPIIGATTKPQLERVLGAESLRLSSDVLSAIEAVHRAHPMPY